MSADENQKRYEDILKQIARRKPFGNRQPENQAATPQDCILDLMNAWDALASLTQRAYGDIVCYGPKSIRGAAWSAAVIWYHSKGYYGYRKLNLLGIWTHYINANLTLTIGIRQLPYQSAIYNPESYHTAIQRGFKLYYSDKGMPPDDKDRILFQEGYQSKKHLTFRQALHDALRQWQSEIDSA